MWGRHAGVLCSLWMGEPLQHNTNAACFVTDLSVGAQLCPSPACHIVVVAVAAVCLLQAVRVYEVMTASGVEPNGASYSAALTSYARGGQLDAALGLFNAMGSRGYERGNNTYAAVLAACERPGRCAARWYAVQRHVQRPVHTMSMFSGCHMAGWCCVYAMRVLLLRA